MDDLEALIRRFIILGKKSAKGYETVKCAKCNDYKERGGFKFELGKIHYSCFNCGISAGFDPEKSLTSVPRKFKEVLLAFNVPESEIEAIVKAEFFKRGTILKTSSEETVEPQKRHVGYPDELSLPRGTRDVVNNDDVWAQVATEYLKTRALTPSDYRFMVCSSPAYQGRILIPYFFRSKVIYWQGRSMDDSIQPRYKNPLVEKENIFFNMDELYRHTDEPLFVSEGPLDAISIGQLGTALTGSTLTEFKIQELERVAKRRPVVFVLDKNENGRKLGMQALDLGFHVTVFPDNIDDANHALQRHGKLWLISYLASNHVTGFEGRLMVQMKCNQ